MIKLKWINASNVPNDLQVKQVYGVLFTTDGRVMLKIEQKNNALEYSLIGGTPEAYDKNMVDTLRREVGEEVSSTIGNPIMLGYQLVDEQNGKQPYAQVRMVAIINNVGESKPDPDGGETYLRLLTNYKKAIKLLNWGGIGKAILNKAFKIAKKQLALKVTNKKEEYV